MVATIGFVGLGVMGSKMAARLLDAGHGVVVYNRSSNSVVPLVARGATAAGTPAEVARASAHVFSCVLDTAAVEDVCFGGGGLIEALRPGQVLVEHATFAPAMARRIAAAAQARGAEFLDAPVTGGPDGAEAGTLTAMIGGSEQAIALVSPFMSCYLQEFVRVGDVGRGLELKLVNQLLVSCHLAAAAEAAALIRELGLPAADSERVLMAGWASSAMLVRVLPAAAAGQFASRGATIGGLIEVQRLIAELAAGLNLELELFRATRDRFIHATAQGLAGNDPAALATTYRPSPVTKDIAS
jgi:3-hydroxyisobutyrate dehydrogenase-like beta-hydroxyacid dehydrogenase